MEARLRSRLPFILFQKPKITQWVFLFLFSVMIKIAERAHFKSKVASKKIKIKNMAEISNSENLEGEETLANMTDQEKQDWATKFLEERGFSVNGGKSGEGKEDALRRAASGTTRKPGSHKS